MVSSLLVEPVCAHGLCLAPFSDGTPAFMGGREENTCESWMIGLWRGAAFRLGRGWCRMQGLVWTRGGVGIVWLSVLNTDGKAVSWSSLHRISWIQLNLGFGIVAFPKELHHYWLYIVFVILLQGNYNGLLPVLEKYQDEKPQTFVCKWSVSNMRGVQNKGCPNGGSPKIHTFNAKEVSVSAFQFKIFCWKRA